jgi:hypothetical protein
MRERATIRRSAADRTAETQRARGAVSSIVQQGTATGGHALPPQARANMEERFGHDFSAVRVHHDSAASRSAEALAANAYTVGADIVFNQGTYAPDSADGQRLLAHELTHVVQQDIGAGPSDSTHGGLELGRTDDPAEREADDVSAQVVSSAPASMAQVADVAAAAPAVARSVIRRDAQEVPETTISVSPGEQAAWNAGYEDARAGTPNAPFSRGLGPNQNYVDGYNAGVEAGPSTAHEDPEYRYDGPSIGPLSAEQAEHDAEEMKRQEEREEAIRELLGEYGNENPEHMRVGGASHRALEEMEQPRPFPIMPRMPAGD